jgi:hypothetical protein
MLVTNMSFIMPCKSVKCAMYTFRVSFKIIHFCGKKLLYFMLDKKKNCSKMVHTTVI